MIQFTSSVSHNINCKTEKATAHTQKQNNDTIEMCVSDRAAHKLK